jgi:hypothetical protein
MRQGNGSQEELPSSQLPNRLSGSERELNLQHLLEVDFALGPGEPIASNLHPIADGSVGSFGGGVIQPGVSTSKGCRRKMLQFIEAAERHLTLQFHKRFSLKASRVSTAMPEYTTQAAH